MLSPGARIIRNSTHFHRMRELFLYLLFGGLAALASLSVSWTLYEELLFPTDEELLFPGLPYWCTTAVAAAIGLLVNFILNYLFNFRFHERTAFQQFWTFCAVSGLGILLTSFLSETLLFIIKSNIGNNIILDQAIFPAKFVANFVAVGLVVLYSFPAHRSISFNVGIGMRMRQLRTLLASLGTQNAALKSTEQYK